MIYMDKQHQTSNEEKGRQDQPVRSTEGGEQEDVQISPPRIDRPDGPFEHSGETFNWTKEEKEEKEDHDGQA